MFKTKEKKKKTQKKRNTQLSKQTDKHFSLKRGNFEIIEKYHSENLKRNENIKFIPL